MNLGTIVGIQIALVGLVAFGLSPSVRRRWPGSAAFAAIIPSLLLIGGIALGAVSAFGGATPLSSARNPVAATVTSVDAGNRLYQANCAACHGVDAQGGGPLANTTPIQPPSLKAHLTEHTDGDLFYWITNGLPGGMPAWASTLSETDRWNLINFLRAINQPGASSGAASSGAASADTTPSAPGASALRPGARETLLGALALPVAWTGLTSVVLVLRRRRPRRSGRRSAEPGDVSRGIPSAARGPARPRTAASRAGRSRDRTRR